MFLVSKLVVKKKGGTKLYDLSLIIIKSALKSLDLFEIRAGSNFINQIWTD